MSRVGASSGRAGFIVIAQSRSTQVTHGQVGDLQCGVVGALQAGQR